MDCTPTPTDVLVVAVLETRDEVTAVVLVVVVVVYCICSSIHTQQIAVYSVHGIYGAVCMSSKDVTCMHE